MSVTSGGTAPNPCRSGGSWSLGVGSAGMSPLCGIWRPRATRSRSSLPGLWCRPRRRGSRTCAGRTSSAIWWLAPRSIVCTLRRALRFQKWTRWPYFLRLSGELRKTADDALNHIFETLVSATSARNAASNSVWGTNIVPQAMQMRLFAHCVTKARQKARHQLVVGRRLRCYLIIACHASRFVLAHAAQDHSPLVGHQSSLLCPSYPACIINMSGYDFRKSHSRLYRVTGGRYAALSYIFSNQSAR